MILPETFEELMNMNIAELWKTYNGLMEEQTEDETQLKHHYTQETEQIENGYKLKIPIWYYINEWYEPYPTTQKVKVTGYGKYNLITFIKEKEQRENTMRRIINEHMETGTSTEPRT